MIRVVDGDSLWVRPPGRAPLRLRLSGVDAPEVCQRHGPQARDIADAVAKEDKPPVGFGQF